MQEYEARQWAMGTHLMALTAFVLPLGLVFGPPIFWLVRKDEHPSVDRQGREAVNFGLSITLYMVLLFVLVSVLVLAIVVASGASFWASARNQDPAPAIGSIVGASLLMLLVLGGFFFLGLFWLICVIVAAARANHGSEWRYPMRIPFVGQGPPS